MATNSPKDSNVPINLPTVNEENEKPPADEEKKDAPTQEESPLQKPKKRKSKVWDEFTEIELQNGTKKAKCNHCRAMLAINAGGSTTHFHRHMSTCVGRQLADKKQKRLAAEPMGPEGLIGNLTTYRYDKEKIREILAKMVIVHEYPFRMIEHELFVVLLKALNPRFEKISRVTLRSDCMKIFAAEKRKLKEGLGSVNRISLTADLWTSNQTIGYLCLTGHYLDSEWKLQKRVLNFCALPPPHTGVAISDCIFQCLCDWGIDSKVSTITLDNATSNDVAVRNLKDLMKGKLFLKGKIFHLRCSAHVLNLMVQDGLAIIRDVIGNVRESVKYIKMSPSRLHKFSEIVKQLQLPTSKRLILDVSTRWNSTYAMLEAALMFKEAFPRYKERDPCYQWLPSIEDWKKANEVCQFLEIFNDVTKIFSGSSYPTSNLFLPEIWKVKQILDEKSLDEHDYMKKMTSNMKEKFDKYWGDCNLLMAIAAVLDPRFKMKLIEFCFPKIYASSEVELNINLVQNSLYEIYNDYVAFFTSSNRKVQEAQDVRSTSSNANTEISSTSGMKTRGRAEFDLWAKELDNVEPIKSELDMYLEEGLYVCKEDLDAEFDALNWWKTNTLKFRILSNMACDILSIPITTVASESTFSAGGRVLDQYRSSLKPETMQALICTGDWLRGSFEVNKPIEVDDEAMQDV